MISIKANYRQRELRIYQVREGGVKGWRMYEKHYGLAMMSNRDLRTSDPLAFAARWESLQRQRHMTLRLKEARRRATIAEATPDRLSDDPNTPAPTVGPGPCPF